MLHVVMPCMLLHWSICQRLLPLCPDPLQHHHILSGVTEQQCYEEPGT